MDPTGNSNRPRPAVGRHALAVWLESAMDSDRGPDTLPESTDSCPRCGARFACGMATGRCWCAALPLLAPLPAGLPPACLCPACLKELSMRQAPDQAGGR